jgi:hypothetical protein
MPKQGDASYYQGMPRRAGGQVFSLLEIWDGMRLLASMLFVL